MRRIGPFAGALLLYLALAIALTFPLVLRLSSALPLDEGDPVLNAWILWWNAHHVPLTAGWWSPPAFFPLHGVMAFSEHLLGLTPLTSPIQWLGGSPILAYNVAFLLSFPLCAIAAHLLGFSLTRRHDAALITGLAYGFAPYRVSQLAHLQMLSVYWMPIALLGLHRYALTRRVGWLALFGTAWLLQALTNGYYLFFFSVLVVLWLVWFLPPWREMRACLSPALAWLLAAVPLVPVLYGYRAIHQVFDFRRDVGEAEFFSADILSLFHASPLLAFWRLPPPPKPEGDLFLGLTVTACLAGGLVWAWRQRASGPGMIQGADGLAMKRVRSILVAVAIAAAGVAASVLIVGPWQVDVLGVSLSIRRIDKVLAFAFLSLTGLLVTTRVVRNAHRRGSISAFYALAAGAMFILCLGPSPRILGAKVLWYKAPYAWLMILPGFDSVRVPARFAMLVVLCLAIVAGLVAAKLARRAGRWSVALIGVLAIGVLADGWIGAMPLVAEPARAAVLDGSPGSAPVLELPVCDTSTDMAAEYRTRWSGAPTINGCSGYRPRHFELLCTALERRDPEILDELASTFGALHVIVNRRRDADGGWERYVSGQPGMERVGADDRQVLFRLAATPTPPPTGLGPPLSLGSITTDPPSADTRKMIDGNRWSSWVGPAPQQGSETVTVDLGTSRKVRAVRLALGPRVTEYPRRLVIDTSENGHDWIAVWEGLAAALAFRAALADQRTVPLTIDIGDRTARFVRLRQVGRDDRDPWSISELQILPPSLP